MNERRFISVIPLIVAAIPVAALARDCNQVKTEMQVRYKANGITNFNLEIVDASNLDLKRREIVGTCDGGAKKIVYRTEGVAGGWMLRKTREVVEWFRSIAVRFWKAIGM